MPHIIKHNMECNVIKTLFEDANLVSSMAYITTHMLELLQRGERLLLICLGKSKLLIMNNEYKLDTWA